MTKIPRYVLVFAIILLQTSAAIICGLAGIYFAAGDRVFPGVYVNNTEIGGLIKEDAVKLLLETVDDPKEKTIHIKYGSALDYEIRYEEIDAEFDPHATISGLTGNGSGQSFINIIKGCFSGGRTVISPVVRFNEKKLEEMLHNLSLILDKQAVNANVYLNEDKLIKIPGINGLKLDIKKTAARISENLDAVADTNIELTSGEGGEIDVIYPERTTEYFNGIEEIIAQYSTDIKNPEDAKSIEIAAKAINRVLVNPVDAGQGEEAGVFSFNEYLGMANAIVEENNEGYNQVASTLYAAVLIAGIDPDSIARSHHTETVDYIEPGLDVVVFGNTVDFKFRNTLQHPVMVFAGVRDGKVIVTLAGKKKDSSLENSIKIDVEQRFAPSVVYMETKTLVKGEMKQVSPGKEGLKLSVYVIASSGGSETGRRLVEKREYKAVESIVLTGPDTGWESGLSK